MMPNKNVFDKIQLFNMNNTNNTNDHQFIIDRDFCLVCEIVSSKYCHDIIKKIIYPNYKDLYYLDSSDKCWKNKLDNSIIEYKNIKNIFNNFIKNLTKKILYIIYISNIKKQNEDSTNPDLSNIEKANFDHWLVSYKMILSTYRYFSTIQWNNALDKYTREIFYT
jgi:hypothetical protein